MSQYLYLHAPAAVFKARVNRPVTPTYPVSLIAYDGITLGSESDVHPGMTLLLGSTAGADDLGRTRVKSISSLAHEIQIGAASIGYHDGEVTIVDNSYITILNDYRVWAKIPFILDSGEILKDGVDLPTGNINHPTPIANAGPPMAGTIDSVTGKLRVTFDGGESFAFTAGSQNVVLVDTYLWDIPGGTVISGSTTSQTLTVDFTPGFRYVRLTVTNTAWSKSHTAVVPVFARDPDNDVTIPFQIISREMTQSGQQVSVGIFQTIDRATYPDGSLALIWDGEPFAPYARTHMQFMGWHQTDETKVRNERTGVTYDTVLNLVDAAGRLDLLPGFPQRVEVSDTPSLWTQTDHNTILWYIYYLLYWHSTVLDVTDFILGSHILDTFEFITLGSERDTLFQQAASLVQNVCPDHLLLCNRQGQLVVEVDPMLLPLDLRVSMVDVSGHIYDTEYDQITISNTRPPRVANIDGGAILSGSDYVVVGGEDTIPTVWCKAPGTAKGQGSQSITSQTHIATSQANLNNTEGNRYARLNSPYGPITVTMPWAAKDTLIEPGNAQWVILHVSDLQPQRPFTPPVPYSGSDFAGTLSGDTVRCLCKQISVAYDYDKTGDTATATITLEVETAGPPALTAEGPG